MKFALSASIMFCDEVPCIRILLMYRNNKFVSILEHILQATLSWLTANNRADKLTICLNSENVNTWKHNLRFLIFFYKVFRLDVPRKNKVYGN